MSVTALHDAARTDDPPADPVEAERAHRKTAVAATLRLFAQLGYEFGFNGHVTVRDPGPDDLYWANPYGFPFALTTASDLVLVDKEGTILEGRHPTSAAGFRSTYGLHSARPDAVAVVHVHSPYGFAWASDPRLLEPVNTDAALLHGLQAVHDDFGQPSGKTPAQSLGDRARVLIQRGHGFVTIGESVEEAAFYFMAAERAAHAQLLLAAAGRGDLVAADLRAKWTLTPQAAREHYLPHLRQILHDQPEVSQ